MRDRNLLFGVRWGIDRYDPQRLCGGYSSGLRGVAMKLYEYIDKAIYNYASCYDAPDTSKNEQFSDALVDVIDLIRESSIGELELIEDDDSPFDDEEDE